MVIPYKHEKVNFLGDLIIKIYLAENFKVFKQTALESNNIHENSFFVWKDNTYYLVG